MNIIKEFIELEKDEDILKDFIKKYKNTILFVYTKESTNPHILEFKDICADNQLVFYNSFNESVIFPYEDNLIQKIEIPIIEKGWYQVKNKPFYCYKNAYRQWLRGVCDSSYNVVPFYTLFQCTHRNATVHPFYSKSIHIKQSLFEAVKNQLIPDNNSSFKINSDLIDQDQYQIINKKWLLINNHFSKTKSFSLFYHQYFIAFINPNLEITLINPIFKQELFDDLIWKHNKLTII